MPTATKSKPPVNGLGERIQQARSKLGLSQIQLGNMIGLDGKSAGAYICRLEVGVGGRPRTDNLLKIAAALGVEVGWLLRGS